MHSDKGFYNVVGDAPRASSKRHMRPAKLRHYIHGRLIDFRIPLQPREHGFFDFEAFYVRHRLEVADGIVTLLQSDTYDPRGGSGDGCRVLLEGRQCGQAEVLLNGLRLTFRVQLPDRREATFYAETEGLQAGSHVKLDYLEERQ